MLHWSGFRSKSRFPDSSRLKPENSRPILSSTFMEPAGCHCRGEEGVCLRARAAQGRDRRQLGGAASRNIARDEDGDDGEDRSPEIMAPIPGDEEMVRV